MTKIKLYIAASLDGFIAREDGSLDWLEKLPNPNNVDYGYADFYATIDTVLMGRTTYEEILSFGVDWPYQNCNNYILTSNKNYQTKTENTALINTLDKESIEQIKQDSKKDIWIIGGGRVITEFLNLEVVDEMILCIIPTIIGSGIKLFPNNPKETEFDLVKSESFSTGAVLLTYSKKKK